MNPTLLIILITIITMTIIVLLIMATIFYLYKSNIDFKVFNNPKFGGAKKHE